MRIRAPIDLPRARHLKTVGVLTLLVAGIASASLSGCQARDWTETACVGAGHSPGSDAFRSCQREQLNLHYRLLSRGGGGGP